MVSWQELEFEYAKRLRASSRDERRTLYSEAYSAVSGIRMKTMSTTDIEKRTAGTSRSLVGILARVCRSDDRVLELGCGRGYTCLKLAPHVKEIIGSDVSDPSLEEARELLQKHGIDNAQILKFSSDELASQIAPESFDKVISIDLFEHLHSEDGLEHLKQVYSVLKPNGVYIIVAPNRIDGPHDITRDIYPDAKEAMGFHLNETTKSELISHMRRTGFRKFYSVLPFASKVSWLFDIWYPAWIDCFMERWYEKTKWPDCLKRQLVRFIRIRMMAVK